MFLKYTGRNWPSQVFSFYLPVFTSWDDPVHTYTYGVTCQVLPQERDKEQAPTIEKGRPRRHSPMNGVPLSCLRVDKAPVQAESVKIVTGMSFQQFVFLSRAQLPSEQMIDERI